jgi:1-acyl-sn-glycerol-3-phosphate acyltransferase
MRAKLGKTLLDALGWTIVGEVPSVRKFVLVAAPHTSNWDFLYALACTTALELPVRWLGKDALFRGPQRRVLEALGGIPVDRSKRNDMVRGMVHAFESADALALLVPAEGTRKHRKYWKSGFYHIARAASVPVVLGFLDYPRKHVGLGPTLWPSGSIHHDMAAVRAFYADKVGKHPAQFTVPRLREEEQDARSGLSN